MAAGRYSFVIEQGATVNFQVAYTDSNGNPVNLTGYQARMQIRPSVGSNQVYITLSSSLDIYGTGLNLSGSNGINPPTSGTSGVYISAFSSSQLNFTQGVYDLEISSGSGNYAVVTRLLEGQVQLSQNITSGSF
jgi:hypothetical protein